MWHETLYNVLNNINSVILMIIGIPFSLQLINMLFFWIKKKKYPHSDKQARVAYVICGHNEEDVIYDTVRDIFDNQKYPRSLYDVFVVCHNCKDNTAKEAERAGAKVIVYDDPDPSTHKLCYAIDKGFKHVIGLDEKYDFFIRLDADNHINADYTSLMNDAYQAGVVYARPYESSLNILQNKFTKACGLYYAFDSRVNSRVRERLHLGAHVNGPGMMITTDIIRKRNGYAVTSISDDAELTADLMDQKIFGHYVEDAIVYEDLPSTMKDTYYRNKRIGAGSIRLIFGKIGALFFKFFTRFKLSYLEYFLTFFLCIVSILCCTWLPIFYIYDLIYLGMAGNGLIEVVANDAAYYLALFNNTWIIMVSCVSVLFLFCGVLQAFIIIMSDHKKLGVEKKKDLLIGMLLFPIFSAVYIATLTIGCFSKPSWGKVKRNSDFYKNQLNKG